MPLNGEPPLARFVHALVRGDGYSFGKPALSADGSRVDVPVLQTRARPQAYTPTDAIADAISAVDLGRLDRVRVRNESEVRVFFPPGTLFEGHGTPSRGTCSGFVLQPGAVRDVEVKCVQPDQPIGEGAPLRLALGPATAPLTQALLSRDQGLVWATVRASGAPERGGARLLQSPSPGGACGIIVLDAEGVLAAEICDSPGAWRGISRSWTPAREASRHLALDPAGAVAFAEDFLERLPQRAYRALSPEGWVATDGSAALTVVDGEAIHLIAFGRDLVGIPFSSGAGGVPSGLPPEPALSLAEPMFAPSPSGDSDVAVAEAALTEAPPDVSSPGRGLRRRKVLTSGWDGGTFESLERYSRKEFRGDRSAAIRSLVRIGLRDRGYMGPLPVAPVSGPVADLGAASVEARRGALEVRIRDLERVAAMEAYADWLRARARDELERLATAAPDEFVRSTAEAACDRLPPQPLPEEVREPEEIAAAAPAEPPEAAAPPVDVRPLLRRAFADSAMGRYPEALSLFEDILLADPANRTALLGRAVALRRSGKAQEALDALDRVLEAEPTNAAALLNRGRILQERGDLEGALGTFDRLASVAPNDWDVWMVRGDALAKLGRRPEALRAYQEALRRNPDDADLQARIRALESAHVAAPPTVLPRPAMPRGIEEGQSYLVRERGREVSFPLLRAMAGPRTPALLITARSRSEALRELGVAGVRIVGLSYALGEDMSNPTALAGLTRTIERFVGDNEGRGLVLLDGLDELVLNNGSREAILFVERVHEAILQSHAIFLLSLPPGALSEKEVALLERSLKAYP